MLQLDQQSGRLWQLAPKGALPQRQGTQVPGLPVPGAQGVGMPAKAEGLAGGVNNQDGEDPGTPAADDDREPPEALTGRAGVLGGASGGHEVFDPFPRCPLEGGRQVGLPVRPPLSPATPRRADFLRERAFHLRHWFSGANEVGIGECQQEVAEHSGMTVEFEDVVPRKGGGPLGPGARTGVLSRGHAHEGP